jgi:hypothetical protein
VKPILSDLGLVTKGDESAWAVTSPDDRYRYVLARTWDAYFDREASARPLWVFGMLNPSTARHDVEDPTVRKCIGFARRGGAGGFLIVNLAAYSTPEPRELVRAHLAGVNVVGEHNAAAVHWALSRPALLGLNIAAWGRVPPKLRSVTQATRVQFMGAQCFGLTADGSPRHPLMLAYATPLRSFGEESTRRIYAGRPAPAATPDPTTPTTKEPHCE